MSTHARARAIADFASRYPSLDSQRIDYLLNLDVDGLSIVLENLEDPSWVSGRLSNVQAYEAEKFIYELLGGN